MDSGHKIKEKLRIWKGCVICPINTATIQRFFETHHITNSSNSDIKNIDGYQNRVERDGESYHLTVIDPIEIKLISSEKIKTLESLEISSDDLFLWGVGSVSNKDSKATYIVVTSKKLQYFRKSLGLGHKYFHITLGFSYSDVHDKKKSFLTIYNYNIENLVNNLNQEEQKYSFISEDVSNLEDVIDLDLIELDEWLNTKVNNNITSSEALRMNFIKKVSLYFEALDMNINLFKLWHRKSNFDAVQKLSKLIDTMNSYNTLSSLYLDSKLNQDKTIDLNTSHKNFSKNALNKNIIIDSDYFLERSLNVLNAPLLNNVKWLYKLKQERERIYSFYEFDRNTNSIVRTDTPRNFTWITNTVSGSSIPKKEEEYTLFKKLGIDTIITLMEDTLPSFLLKHCQSLGIRHHHFAVDDRTPMSMDQMKEIYKVIKLGNKTLIHCMGGVGRTATAIICYLIANGKTRFEAMQMMEVRKTILSKSQEDFIKDWTDFCLSGKLKDFEDSLKIKRSPKIKLPQLIILVGLPASGKSTFSTTVQDQIKNVERVNQDEIRTKGKCEELFSKYSKKNVTLILDRCNFDREERRYWMKLNASSTPKVWCIYFSASSEECKWRIKNRKDHPTVKAGHGATIIDSVKDKLEIPDKSEGFERIIEVSSFKESNQLLLEIGCDISHIKEENYDGIIKFPRTKHLYNLGAATRDDLILDNEEIAKFLNRLIFLEEKIDGANMGISIQDYKIVVQNRSHYVNSGTHIQFKLLDSWVSDHSADLWSILGDGNKILYGEWVYAKHSIHYTNLPDYFIAFDLFDKTEKRFYSRSKLEEILKDTNISYIPTVKEGRFKKVEDIVDLVKNKSQFYDGPIEGLYCRICSDNWLEERAKIVRNDFISGNEHWTKNQITKNLLRQN